MGDEIASIVGEYPVDVRGFRTENKDWLLDSIYDMTRKHFQVVRHYLQNAEWDYFQFLEIGVDRIHHGFWKFHDPKHRLFEPDNPYQNAIRDYYRYLDGEIGSILELLDEDTIVLIVSDHGAQALEGGFCVNEWFVRNGLLKLQDSPTEVMSLGDIGVDWGGTKVWAEGGYSGRLYFNVKGREPNGVIDPSDYESFRDDLKSQLEAVLDDAGAPMGTRVFKPEEIYSTVNNIPPDLIVYFGDLAWRAIGGVGYSDIHVLENDTGPDDCNHSPYGVFVLASSNNPLRGSVDGVHIMDIAPTLLELSGHDTPKSMRGKSIVGGATSPGANEQTISEEGAEAVKRRLKGLGYI